MVAAGHPWSRRRRPISANELAKTPLVLREPGSGTREVLTDALRPRVLSSPWPWNSAHHRHQSSGDDRRWAGGGVGPGRRAEVQTGQLVTVPCKDLSLQRTIRAIWAPNRPPSAVSARLLTIAARPVVTRP